MSKTNAKKSKNIALIDKDLILYLALIEQNDFHDTNYFWQNFKNVELLNHACKTKNFDLILFNDSSLEAEKIQSDHPIFANSSICPIIILSTNHESKFTSPKFDKITHFSIIHKISYSIKDLAKMFKTKIKYLKPRSGERYASALTKMSNNRKIINKYGKIDLKDYVTSVSYTHLTLPTKA